MAFIIIICNVTVYDGIVHPIKCNAATELSSDTIKKLYNNLSQTGKDNFNGVLNQDDTLYNYHKKYVDNSYVKQNTKIQIEVFSKLSGLNSELAGLGLPTAVRYALMAIASGISAGLADGPLPVGDIIGIFASIGGIAVLVYYWPKIEKKWPKIEKAFEKCFRSISSNIKKTFAKVKIKILNKYYSQKFNRFEYHYQKHADEFSKQPGGNGKKPNREKYFYKAKHFLKQKGDDIIEGKNLNENGNEIKGRIAKFNKKTLEYLVYEKKTKKIISYYLPKYSDYIKKEWSLNRWSKAALNYALKHIAQ